MWRWTRNTKVRQVVAVVIAAAMLLFFVLTFFPQTP